MPVNIEFKAKVQDCDGIRNRLEKISEKDAVKIFQEDIFFNAVRGRLKLRTFSDGKGELIYYLRNDAASPRRCDYAIFNTDAPETLKNILELSLGIRGVLKKNRLLYLVGNTRIHLDEVENLGLFIEIEVVLDPEQTENDGKAIADNLIAELKIDKKDLIDVAYIDLLLDNSNL
jgi:predicted adenylyl cyclase CyaB